MRRSTLLLSTLCLAAMTVHPAPTSAAGPPVSGTIACTLEGYLGFRPYLPLLMGPPAPNRIRLIDRDIVGACDSSGVVGGGVPITQVELRVRGAIAGTSTCLDLVNTLSIQKTKVKMRWRGVKANGKPVTVAQSDALLASGSFDTGTNELVLATAPITKGAFLGSTLTWRVPFGDLEEYDRICSTVEGAFSGLIASPGYPWFIEIP